MPVQYITYMITSSNGNISVLLTPCAGNSPVPVNSPHKGQWDGALMFSLICAWISGWVNNREAGELRRHRGHYDVNVMYKNYVSHYFSKRRSSSLMRTLYPKKYAHVFCFAVLCCGYTLTDFPISTRLTSLALWQSNDCPSASKATLMKMYKYFMWIHYERLHNHNKAKHNKTVCIFLGIYCICVAWSQCDKYFRSRNANM